MRGKTPAGDLSPLDLEIEATCRKNNAKKKRRKLLKKVLVQLKVFFNKKIVF